MESSDSLHTGPEWPLVTGSQFPVLCTRMAISTQVQTVLLHWGNIEPTHRVKEEEQKRLSLSLVFQTNQVDATSWSYVLTLCRSDVFDGARVGTRILLFVLILKMQ